ncbi:MAG: class I SAM-dependent methyltransferase [Longimicrobiales bacterium]
MAPSMLDMVRLSPRRLFPPGGVDLYRQIALLSEMAQGEEVLDVAAGTGAPLEYFAREHGVHGSGVEADPRLVEVADARARAEGMAARIQFQTAPFDALPYRDQIFDVVVGELGFAAYCDAADAVGEMVRVAKRGGRIVLVRLVWKAPVDAARQERITRQLGARPLMLVEWKRMLRDAGVTGVHIEDWSEEETSFRPRVDKPFPDFSEVFTVWEKLVVLRRAWARWGFRGVRWVLEREWEIHRLLTHERILGLVLLVGRRAPAEGGPDDAPGGSESPRETLAEAHVAGTGTPGARRGGRRGDAGGGNAGTAGLPLFGAGAEKGKE